MKVTSKEELIKRLRAAGLEPREQPSDVPIWFTISNQTTDDVTEDVIPLSIGFQEQILQGLKNKTINSEISGIVIFPTIFDSAVTTASDFVTYKRDKSVFVITNLDHEEWIGTSQLEKVDLYAQALVASICRIKEKRLFPSDRQLLLGVIEQARRVLRKKRAN